jgi:hypothetical protein
MAPRVPVRSTNPRAVTPNARPAVRRLGPSVGQEGEHGSDPDPVHACVHRLSAFPRRPVNPGGDRSCSHRSSGGPGARSGLLCVILRDAHERTPTKLRAVAASDRLTASVEATPRRGDTEQEPRERFGVGQDPLRRLHRERRGHAGQRAAGEARREEPPGLGPGRHPSIKSGRHTRHSTTRRCGSGASFSNPSGMAGLATADRRAQKAMPNAGDRSVAIAKSRPSTEIEPGGGIHLSPLSTRSFARSCACATPRVPGSPGVRPGHR